MANTNEQVTKLLDGATANGIGTVFSMPRGSPQRSFVADMAGTISTGNVSATVRVDVSNDGVNFHTGYASLSLTGVPGDVKATNIANSPFAHVRGSLTSITGTGAAVNLWMGI